MVCFCRVFGHSDDSEYRLPSKGNPPVLESQAIGDRDHVHSLHRHYHDAFLATAGGLSRPTCSPSSLSSLACCPRRRHNEVPWMAGGNGISFPSICAHLLFRTRCKS